MSRYMAFENQDGTHLLLEVEESAGTRAPGKQVKAGLSDKIGEAVRVASSSLQDALSMAIFANASALHRGLQEISPAPTEVEMSFALKAVGELGVVAVGKVGGEANYNVKLVWKAPSMPVKEA
jgi:hypothetical protein